MALGYEIGTIMRRRSKLFKSGDGEGGAEVTVKLDEIETLGDFVQARTGGGGGGGEGGCGRAGPGCQTRPVSDGFGGRRRGGQAGFHYSAAVGRPGG